MYGDLLEADAGEPTIYESSDTTTKVTRRGYHVKTRYSVYGRKTEVTVVMPDGSHFTNRFLEGGLNVWAGGITPFSVPSPS